MTVASSRAWLVVSCVLLLILVQFAQATTQAESRGQVRAGRVLKRQQAMRNLFDAVDKENEKENESELKRPTFLSHDTIDMLPPELKRKVARTQEEEWDVPAENQDTQPEFLEIQNQRKSQKKAGKTAQERPTQTVVHVSENAPREDAEDMGITPIPPVLRHEPIVPHHDDVMDGSFKTDTPRQYVARIPRLRMAFRERRSDFGRNRNAEAPEEVEEGQLPPNFENQEFANMRNEPMPQWPTNQVAQQAPRETEDEAMEDDEVASVTPAQMEADEQEQQAQEVQQMQQMQRMQRMQQLQQMQRTPPNFAAENPESELNYETPAEPQAAAPSDSVNPRFMARIRASRIARAEQRHEDRAAAQGGFLEQEAETHVHDGAQQEQLSQFQEPQPEENFQFAVHRRHSSPMGVPEPPKMEPSPFQQTQEAEQNKPGIHEEVYIPPYRKE